MRTYSYLVVSDWVPLGWKKNSRTGKASLEFERITDDANVWSYPSTKKGRKAKWHEAKPCIYVNPSGLLAQDAPIKNYIWFANQLSSGPDITLAEVRAVVLLHELAHIIGVIPDDGRDVKNAIETSLENTRSVMRNCIRFPVGKVLGCQIAQKETSQ